MTKAPSPSRRQRIRGALDLSVYAALVLGWGPVPEREAAVMECNNLGERTVYGTGGCV